MARHSDPGGRFTIPWEQQSMFQGIDAELRAPVGQHIDWIRFNEDESRVDPIYDVADQVVGRVWDEPIRIPAYAALIFQGVSMHNERGFYNTDVLRVSVTTEVMEKVFPELVWNPDSHIKDRVLYRGKVFIPTRIYLRGLLRNSHTIFTIDANQVNPEEYVNDPDLVEWANRRTVSPPQPYDPQKVRLSTTL
jgi:hypothetical protein